MRIGYARVSTNEQHPVSQIDALTEAGCERIYTETASGARRDRPELARALDVMREGDTLVVWKLDRLARSLGQLIETVRDFDRRGIGFISLTDQIDTTSAGGRLLFHIMGAIAEFERDLSGSARTPVSMRHGLAVVWGAGGASSPQPTSRQQRQWCERVSRQPQRLSALVFRWPPST